MLGGQLTFTSAKSTLISPGTVMMSEMPWQRIRHQHTKTRVSTATGGVCMGRLWHACRAPHMRPHASRGPEYVRGPDAHSVQKGVHPSLARRT
jgi:hypothetical protein